MGGISSAIQPQTFNSFLPIVMAQEEYRIRWFPFSRSAADPELHQITDRLLNIFWKLERSIKDSQSLDIDPELCQSQLVELAKCGRAAYHRFFENEQARNLLASSFQMMGTEIPAPTFVADTVPFPWELLYEGADYRNCDPDRFWGYRYTPARILTPEVDISQHVMEQAGPADMLFCLHHRLRQAHQQEWPAIQKLILVKGRGKCALLTPKGHLTQVADGESLLEYLDQASHNIVHFACHCEPSDTDVDTLLLSLLKDETCDEEAQVIELGTFTFLMMAGQQFQRRPLVFLNACQSAGGTDSLRKTLNLPQMFMKRGAGALIATVCPVPDLFAAAFARQFYTYFLSGGMTIGQALRETRLYFLEKHHNPLGLAYGLYSPAQYRLAQPPMLGGVA